MYIYIICIYIFIYLFVFIFMFTYINIFIYIDFFYPGHDVSKDSDRFSWTYAVLASCVVS